MNKILRKLRSKAGESMILAMVFMLFCSFVGGSVLASATANAQRVAQVAEEQEFLLERSAALLLRDELYIEQGQLFRLYVVDADQSIQEVRWTNGGVVTPVGNPTRKRVISFQLATDDEDVTEMQKLMLEATVWRYLREYAAGDTYDVRLVHFPSAMDDTSDFSFPYTVPSGSSSDYKVEGAMKVQGTADNVTLPEYTANFSSGREDNLFDFYVDFGELSQLKLTMNAFSHKNDPVTVQAPATEDASSSTGLVQITTVINQTTISWSNPIIEKGGAA